MFSQHYQKQLANLRELAAEFAQAFPVLAPMLKGQTTDPDVERLLEGTAFLAGLLQEKSEDEFPEIIQGLMDLVFPHYLRTLPSATIMAFNPRPNQKQTLRVPAGTMAGSKPVDGTKCIFSTSSAIDVHPLRITSAAFEQLPGKAPLIRLSLELYGLDPAQWEAKSLRFHLAQDYPLATNLYHLLLRHLAGVTISPKEGGTPINLGPEHLKPGGFGDDEALLPYPSHSFPGYRVLQEYFILPQKFLFLELTGFDQWRNRGGSGRFDIVFELNKAPAAPPRLKAEDFVLFATPAVNVFPSDADPIFADHKRTEYRLRPSGGNRLHYQVYSVEKVTGFEQGSVKEVEYDHFNLFHLKSSGRPIYNVTYKRSPLTNTIDAIVTLTYPAREEDPVPQTLSFKITCTNGELADNLKSGAITEATENSPGLLDFINIRPSTASVLPPLGGDLLWRFLSLYSLNYFSIASESNLKALLKLHIFTDSRDQSATFGNLKRADGLAGLEVKPADRLVQGNIIRGQEVKIKLNADHFAGDGDLFLFGSVLDHFFASCMSINCFTRVTVEEVLKGETIRWPAKIGDRALI